MPTQNEELAQQSAKPLDTARNSMSKRIKSVAKSNPVIQSHGRPQELGAWVEIYSMFR